MAAPEDFQAGEVVTLAGSGGARFEVTVPGDGTLAREHFDAKVASGDFVPPVDAVASAEPEPDDEGDDLSNLKVDELRDYAEANGVDLGDATKKADIIAAIQAAEA